MTVSPGTFEQSTPRLTLQGGRVMELVQGDITREDTDAIVNAANSELAVGGGVCGAIHRAGGPAIAEECQKVRARDGSLSAGQAVATTGGRLAARYVIHAVGPVWSGGNSGEPAALASCYRESIRVADELKLNSIAFPAISTGIYGYPVHSAAEIAVAASKDALASASHLRKVRFVLFDQATLWAYATALEALTRPPGGRLSRP